MSYPEFQTEEKAVQLTSEDIRILSEYSWDMAGYTSRFGFFYLGNENADVEGLTKWQAEHIFQLTPIPPGMEDELQNMEKTRRISKEKKKEITRKNEAVASIHPKTKNTPEFSSNKERNSLEHFVMPHSLEQEKFTRHTPLPR